MKEEARKIFLTRVGDLILWLLPLFIALLGHLYAKLKVDLGGSGPGIHIALYDGHTIASQNIWHFLQANLWLFLLYSIVLVYAGIAVRKYELRRYIKVFIFGIMAAPGVWYGLRMVVLGGKLITF